MTAASPTIIILIAIRSDGYERLQSEPRLESVRQETLSLPPLPRGAYQDVIEGPAKRLSQSGRPLVVEPALTQALLEDIEAGGAKDALPLLAFTLERLYVDHGGDGDLTLAEYRQTGGVKGSIEIAVERAMAAADADVRVPQDRVTRLALLRSALIPWLAGIDPETGAPRRRVARFTEIPEEARPLIQHLVTARLLSTDVAENGAATIEPAHEALLRQWGLLQGWLEEDFAALAALDGVKRAKRDWEANARNAGWLSHSGGRLEDAERFGRQNDLKNYLDDGDRAYLSACRERTDADRREREAAVAREAARLAEVAEAQKATSEEQAKRERAQQKTRRLQLIVAAIVGAFMLVAGGLLWLNYRREQEVARGLAENRALSAANEASTKKIEVGNTNLAVGRAKLLAELAAFARERGDYDRALRLATLAAREDPLAREDGPSVARDELARSVQSGWQLPFRGATDEVTSAAFSSDGKRIVIASKDESARIYDSATGRQVLILREPAPPPKSTGDAQVDPRDVTSHAMNSAVFSPDGQRILTASADGTARVWDAASGAGCWSSRCRTNRVHLRVPIRTPRCRRPSGRFTARTAKRSLSPRETTSFECGRRRPASRRSCCADTKTASALSRSVATARIW